MKRKYVSFFIAIVFIIFLFSSAFTLNEKECLKTQHVSSFTTDFSSSIENRKYNIRLATSKISWIVIKPGKTFSFNEVVGARTLENGYKTAIVISFGEYTEGVGGGVCQVSTTLYNAWIRAGLKVQYVKNHTLPTSYVDLSLDAMVSEYSDMVLLNNSDDNVIINGTTTENTVTFDVYAKVPEYEIEIESRFINKISPKDEDVEIVDSFKGYQIMQDKTYPYVVLRNPKDGYHSKAFAIYKKNGEKVFEEELREDFYSPQVAKIGVLREELD